MVVNQPRTSSATGHAAPHGDGFGEYRGRWLLTSPPCVPCRITGFFTALKSAISPLRAPPLGPPFPLRLEAYMGRPRVGQPCMCEIVDVVTRELDAGQLEEARPADSFDPFAHALELPGVGGVHVHQVHHRVDHFRPARRIVRQERDGEFREPGRRAGVAYLPAHVNRDAVILRIVLRHGRRDRVAVAAEHALLFDYVDGFESANHGRPDGPRRTGRYQGWDLRTLFDNLVLDLRRLAMYSEDGDVGAMHRTAHVEAAGHRDANARRQVIVREAIVQRIHHRLHDPGSVRRRRVAVDPPQIG